MQPLQPCQRETLSIAYMNSWYPDRDAMESDCAYVCFNDPQDHYPWCRGYEFDPVEGCTLVSVTAKSFFTGLQPSAEPQ